MLTRAKTILYQVVDMLFNAIKVSNFTLESMETGSLL